MAWGLQGQQGPRPNLEGFPGKCLLNQDDGKGGGVGFKGPGGSLHDGFGGFDGFGGSGERLALLLLVLRNTVPRDDRDGFDGFGGFGGCGGFGRDGYPP